MDKNTKEVYLDMFTLFWNAFLVLLLTYLIVWKDFSAWWYITLLFFRFRFIPSEEIKKD